MTIGNIIAYGTLFSLAFLIARNSFTIAEKKGFNPALAAILTGFLSLLFIIPGLLVNLIYRFVKPRKDWSF